MRGLVDLCIAYLFRIVPATLGLIISFGAVFVAWYMQASEKKMPFAIDLSAAGHLSDIFAILIPFGVLYCALGFVHAYELEPGNRLRDLFFFLTVLFPSFLLLVMEFADTVAYIFFHSTAVAQVLLPWFEVAISITTFAFLPIEFHITYHHLSERTAGRDAAARQLLQPT